MARDTIYTLYMVVIIAITIGIPLMLYYGSDDSLSGLLAAVLSFVVLASYVLYTGLLNRRN
jgi:hypothetical protein